MIFLTKFFLFVFLQFFFARITVIAAVTADDVALNPDDSALNPDDAALNPDGSALNPDGSVLNPDYAALNYDAALYRCIVRIKTVFSKSPYNNFLSAFLKYSDKQFQSVIEGTQEAYGYFLDLLEFALSPNQLNIMSPRMYCNMMHTKYEDFCIANIQMTGCSADMPGMDALRYMYRSYARTDIHLENFRIGIYPPLEEATVQDATAELNAILFQHEMVQDGRSTVRVGKYATLENLEDDYELRALVHKQEMIKYGPRIIMGYFMYLYEEAQKCDENKFRSAIDYCKYRRALYLSFMNNLNPNA